MTQQACDPIGAGFEVAGWVHALSGFIERHRRFWIALGNFETRLIAGALEGVGIEQPVYVCGLARSGTTALLELLARHPAVVTHRYRDFPPLFTPYLWNRWLERVPRRPEQARERTHADRIAITSESPEAFEEVLWMAFFPHLHDPGASAVFDGEVINERFEAFYRDHIRKLLTVRGGRRYVAKGNYNLTRLTYLQRLFPDARFVIPVRDPVWHVASLVKQQRLFTAGCRARSWARNHLRRVGHFEFGPDRRPINAGDTAATAEILACWADGREVEGWARYWANLYGHVLNRLDADARLRQATLIIRYEDLCRRPRERCAELLDHCRLLSVVEVEDEAARRLSLPAYYAPQFDATERAVIGRETGAVAKRFGCGG
ncbi:MAG: sulfotransferase [Gammaproteobacteria bacterium]|nr:sulfotransferase [Gammaproteobacteria bacterium]